MQGAITDINRLRSWFYNNSKPFFLLRYYQPGKAGDVIMKNDSIPELDASWEKLSTEVLSQAEAGRALLQVLVWEVGKTSNNYSALTNLDMRLGVPVAQTAGIGSLPGGYIEESKVQGMLDAEREKWTLERRLEDLEAQINNPADWASKSIEMLERIGATPLGQILAAKFLGVQLPAAQIAGTPAPADEPESDTFEEDIDKAAEILGVSDIILAQRLRYLVETNPDIAKSLLAQ